MRLNRFRCNHFPPRTVGSLAIVLWSCIVCVFIGFCMYLVLSSPCTTPPGIKSSESSGASTASGSSSSLSSLCPLPLTYAPVSGDASLSLATSGSGQASDSTATYGPPAHACNRTHHFNSTAFPANSHFSIDSFLEFSKLVGFCLAHFNIKCWSSAVES